ncbi:MAG: hypothetical protein JXQ96_01725 [Cyclobacteriaceae bacterium]
MKNISYTLLLLTVLFGSTTAQELSPFLFGQNHWIEQNDEDGRPGYINQLWPKIAESGIKLVRIGGNNYNNRNHELFNLDRIKLNSILDSIRGIGAEPLFQIPSGKGETRDLTVDQVVQLVKEYKYQNGKGIRYYCIGNEPLLHDRDGIPKVYEYVMKLAPAMKGADPTIKIFIFDACYLFEEPHKKVLGGELDLTGKDKNGNWMIDGINFHRYPGAKSRDNVVFTGPKDIRRQVEQLMEMMEFANKKHGRKGSERLQWGLTEFNVTTSNPNREIAGIGNTSFLGGQFMAEIYGLGMEFGAFTMAPWCISETDRVSTDFGYLGLPSEFYPRSSYYHTQLMAQNMKGAYLPTESNNSYVKTIASKSDTEISVMIMNSDQYNDFEFDLILNDESPSTKPLTVRADLGMEIVISDNIPNQTTLMLVLSGSGEIIRKYSYGLKQNLKYLPPILE